MAADMDDFRGRGASPGAVLLTIALSGAGLALTQAGAFTVAMLTGEAVLAALTTAVGQLVIAAGCGVAVTRRLRGGGHAAVAWVVG